jgi:hypothetical protein
VSAATTIHFAIGCSSRKGSGKSGWGVQNTTSGNSFGCNLTYQRSCSSSYPSRHYFSALISWDDVAYVRASYNCAVSRPVLLGSVLSQRNSKMFSYWIVLVVYLLLADLSRRCVLALIGAFTGPLSKVPGPLMYKLTPIPWLIDTISGNSMHVGPVLFKKYGDVVRVCKFGHFGFSLLAVS